MMTRVSSANFWVRGLALAAALLGGCATEVAPALREGLATESTNGNGVALLGLTLANTFRVSAFIAQMETAGLFVDGPEADSKPHGQFIHVDKPLSRTVVDGRQVEEHTVSVGLPPGRYRLRCVQTTVAKTAWGCAPVFATFEITAGAVVYLGHIDILRRERKNETELRAGSTVPLFEQWYAGYSSGTFDVAIRDGSDIDIPRFRSRYPSLTEKTTISNAILAPWRRPTQAEAEALP